MKTLVFEGAGWDKAEHNGVGNCRIRATFKNKNGTVFYLELTGHKPHNWSPRWVSVYNHCGKVDHLLVGGSGGERQSLEGHTFEYTKENILGLVNSMEIGGDFEAIEVNNTGWDGFSLTGKSKDRKRK